MADRTVYGLTHSENGWRMVDEGSCVWVRVPGTNVTLQIREGQPAKILGAFAADYNAYVEPLRDADSACWTRTNSVASSNHLSGTGMDLNWNGPDGRTFRLGITKERAFPGDKARKFDELLAFYEGLLFCGGEWSIRDWMHVQMNGGTYGSQNVAKVNDFIARKIRPDGFSTYKRSGVPTAPPPVVTPPPATPPAGGNQVDVLARATGITRQKATQILPTLLEGMRLAECNTVPRIAMFLAQTGHESADFNATEEYQNGPMDQERWIYKGRTYIQLTWRSAYEGFGKWCHARGLVSDPMVFVNNPRSLADLKWAGLGAAYYWMTTVRSTRKYPTLKQASDARDLLVATQIINGGTNGLPDRQRRYDLALSLGDQLLALTSSVPSTPTEGFLMALSEAEQREVLNASRELTKRFPSRSPLRHLGEGLVDTAAGFVLNADGHGHVQLVKTLASLGHPESLALLREVAAADPVRYPDRQEDAKVAQAILSEITAPASRGTVAASVPPPPVTTPAPAPTPAAPTRELADAYADLARVREENARLREDNARLQTENTHLQSRPVEPQLATLDVTNGTTGAAAGRVVDAQEGWTEHVLAMDVAKQAALSKSLQSLQLPNGAQA